MMRICTAILLLLSTPALAQGMNQPTHPPDHQTMTNHQEIASPMGSLTPTQPGQATFAAIQEIVQVLEADPHTDWSKVNIEALRQHLIDMNNVTLEASVKSEPVESGVRFTVTGYGAVRTSIKRMVNAHVATMVGVEGWKFTATNVDDGVILTVIVPTANVAKIRALGFIGMMTLGMHHQQHHLMIARGEHPHG